MKSKKPHSSGLVYSTEHGRMCPECNNPLTECACKQDAVYSGDGILRLRRETKGRKGKGVTIVSGVAGTAKELGKLAKELKARCSSGGTVKEGEIEIQGDHLQTLRELLEKKGYKVKG